MEGGINMWNEEKIINYLNENLKKKRIKHSLGVRDTAVELAKIYCADIEKARLAGLVHDCAKNLNNEEMLNIAEKSGYTISMVCRKNYTLLHGAAGAYIAKTIMGIDDDEIINAVKYHTTGRENMSILEKIIYIADYTEPNRNFPGVEKLRLLSFENLDKALLRAFDNTIKYVVDNGQLLHYDTIKARNYLLCSQKS